MFESASSKKIAVVTGGAGFLGSHLSDRLIAEGFRVIAIDNLVTGSRDNIAHLAGNQDFKFVRHNVSEFIFIPGRVDYIFHFASPASPIDYLELPIPTVSDLIDGIFRLAMSEYHEPVNIGNPREMTILEFANKILEITGSKSEIIKKQLPEDDPKVRRPDITRARQLLCWEPKVDFESGIRETISYFEVRKAA
jgi:nucleoside-diphosphate-sugar epimerase